MPNGRAVLLLRRLSAGDSTKLKNISVNQNTAKDSLLNSPVCNQRDVVLPKRLSSTFGHSNIAAPQLKRSISDNIIKMSASNADIQGNVPKHVNRLINEKSPYLLQHAHNPVDWYPWCQEAIDRAKQENKPIFLSVGYSTCHWCHVMERESFENEDIAKVMNEYFINIKLDREERPDLDQVYMTFVVASTGSGGWPMSIFLTPDLKPIYGGSYFPPEDKYGRPGFKTVLLALSNKWKDNETSFRNALDNNMKVLEKKSLVEQGSLLPGEGVWNKALNQFTRIFEPHFGGFGLAPKFPQPSILNFLFHYYARDKTNENAKKCLHMCLHSLTKMAKGGIHDHIGGGFARYSVDNDWHVPHFEKMLYDQGQLTVSFTDAYLATKDEFYANMVRDIITYVNRDLRHELGGYYSAEDADSYSLHGGAHKKEGAFYTWAYDEIQGLLEGKEINSMPYLDIFCDYFSVEPEGNISPDSDPHEELTGMNVLIVYGSKEETIKKFGLTSEDFDKVIKECIGILYEARLERPRPHLDTKMLCSWNALMISGLARAGQGLADKDYVEDAIKAAKFIKEHMYDESTKTLIHSCYKADDGTVAQINPPIKGFLDDYAFFIKALLDLYEASLDMHWLNWARELQAKQNELFWDETDGGYFNTSTEDSNVILRLKECKDNAEPSGNSVSCHNLIRLAAYSDKSAASEGGDHERHMAEKILTIFSKQLESIPLASPEMVSALMFFCDSPTQVLIAGGFSDPRTLEMVRVVRSRLLPGRVLAVADPAADCTGMSDILISRIRSIGDQPTAYVCRRYACSLPVTDVKQLENLLDEQPAKTSK